MIVWPKLIGVGAHGPPPACVTVKTCPLTTMLADLCGPLLAATEKLTVPLPLAFAGGVMVIHDVSVEMAVQLHPPGAVTLKLPPPVPPLKFWLVGLTDVTQLVPSRKEAMLVYVALKRP